VLDVGARHQMGLKQGEWLRNTRKGICCPAKPKKKKVDEKQQAKKERTGGYELIWLTEKGEMKKRVEN